MTDQSTPPPPNDPTPPPPPPQVAEQDRLKRELVERQRKAAKLNAATADKPAAAKKFEEESGLPVGTRIVRSLRTHEPVKIGGKLNSWFTIGEVEMIWFVELQAIRCISHREQSTETWVPLAAILWLDTERQAAV